jgi:hypothetical protein
MARKAAKTRPSAKSRASGLPRGYQHRPSANANITGRPQPGFNPHQQQGFAVGGFNDMGMSQPITYPHQQGHLPAGGFNNMGISEPYQVPHQQQGNAVGGFNDMGVSPAPTNSLQQLDTAVDPFDHAGDFDFSALLAQDLPMPTVSDEEMAKLQQEIFGDAGDNFGAEGVSEPQTFPPHQLPPVEYFTSSAMPQAPLEQLDLAASATFAFTGTGDFNNMGMSQPTDFLLQQPAPAAVYSHAPAMSQAQNPPQQPAPAAAAPFAGPSTGNSNNMNMPQFIFSDDPAVPEAPVDWIRYRFPSMPIGVYLPPIKAAKSSEEEERGRSDPPSEPTVDGWLWSWSI